MARPGPKTKPNHLKAVSGTARADRVCTIAFPVPEGDATLPSQFERLREVRPIYAEIVLEIWNSQVAKYRERGQPTAGYSRALYQMCLLEADIHERSWNGMVIDTAMRNGLRVYYSEFYDTPAGNVISGGRNDRTNPYADRPPQPPAGRAKKKAISRKAPAE